MRRITPEQAGLRSYGDIRTTRPGLRREEVALLAGVSVDYYTRLERGQLTGASETVLDALARALQLDDAERDHLFDLAHAADATQSTASILTPTLRPSVQRVLDSITAAPAFVRNGRMDILAANRLGRAFYSQHFDSPHGPTNSARFIFLDPRAGDFYVDWERSRLTPSRCSTPRPAATRTTAASPISSVSSRRGARCSARAGRHTTSAPRHGLEAFPPPDRR